eukprot:scaffold40649_cov31-Phaeocystis_antarctica.AAC.1
MPPTPPPPSPCMDKNEPNDPEYCQKAVGTYMGKITNCKQTYFIVNCEQSCGFCLASPSPPQPPPSPSPPP